MAAKKLTYGMHAGHLPLRIINMLRNHGPMCTNQIAMRMPGETYHRVATAVSQLLGAGESDGTKGYAARRIHVAKYERSDLDGASTVRLRAFYAAGNREDAEKPAVLTSQDCKLKRKARADEVRRVASRVPNSVFALARLA